MQCPVCKKNCAKSATFCARCAWAFRMYVGEAPPEEDRRLKIARRNWRIILTHLKSAAKPGKKNLSNPSVTKKSNQNIPESKYSPNTPVPALQRDAFETVEAFHERITKHKPVLAGTAKLIKDRYDIDTGYFPLKIVLKKWAKPFERKGNETYIIADRDLAQAIYTSGPDHPVYAFLHAQGEKAVAQKIELYADNRPLEIIVSLFYIKPKYSLRFKPVNGVSKEEAQSFFDLDNNWCSSATTLIINLDKWPPNPHSFAGGETMRKARNWNQPCPNKECEMYGQMNKGNIISKSTYDTQSGKRRVFECKCCGHSFAETRDTVFFDLKTSEEKVIMALKMILMQVSLAGICFVLGVK